MRKETIYYVVLIDINEIYSKTSILATSTKHKDSQKLYSEALKEHDVSKENFEGGDDRIIAVYEGSTGILMEDVLTEGKKLYASNL